MLNFKKKTSQAEAELNKSKACKLEREDEAVRLNPTGAAIQPWWSSSSRWEQHKHGSRSKFFKGSTQVDVPEGGEGGDEVEDSTKEKSSQPPKWSTSAGEPQSGV